MGVAVSFFVGAGIQFTPIPDSWRWAVTAICAVGFVISIIGWFRAGDSGAPRFETFDPRVIYHEAINKFEISIGFRNIGKRDALSPKKTFWECDYSLTRDSTTRAVESGVDPEQDKTGFAGVTFSISKPPISPQFVVLIISYLKKPRDKKRSVQEFRYKWSGILRNGSYNTGLENISKQERARIDQKMTEESRSFS